MEFPNYEQFKPKIATLMVEVWRKIDPSSPTWNELGGSRQANWLDILDATAFAARGSRAEDTFSGREAAAYVALSLWGSQSRIETPAIHQGELPVEIENIPPPVVEPVVVEVQLPDESGVGQSGAGDAVVTEHLEQEHSEQSDQPIEELA